MKWTRKEVLRVLKEARDAGREAAVRQHRALEAVGPRYYAVDGNKVVGSLLDDCGNAYLKVRARGKFYQLAKEMSDDYWQWMNCCHRCNGGGGLAIVSTHSQCLSVGRAAARAQAEVLRKYGLEAEVLSYVD